MFKYTIVCYGAEIGYGEGETFEEAAREAMASVDHTYGWYPKRDFGYIAYSPSGMQISYNV